ncbi:TAXI family TRAP transporter solute-binding subunit [Mesorhizobium sp. B2-7-1]|uniref:TAXI family TRAP transporter solute-binding subunit n=1 Tax=Mesorhizobium sp. B2-7-1 TaxID=2589909 RepID=UPI00112C2AAB|nr:TAXI family TRAP transporter solute-binding subunit [Mesorhizobium sp. B2-7-1]TPJ64843.1 TAXI family TRAP transporter solute-binding subunit [Mesorhizobium sp. B2-7-1]
MAQAKRKLNWLGGNPGDGWYEMSEGLVALINEANPGLNIQLIAGGGRSNLESVQAGHAHVAMSIDVVTSAARNGGEPFISPMDRLNVLGTGWSPLPYNLLKGPNGPADLSEALHKDGLRFGAPPEDTTDELVFRRVLGFCETSYKDIVRRGGKIVLRGYDALVDALAQREIDYVFGATTLPARSIAQATATKGLRLAPLPNKVISHLAREWGHGSGIIPQSAYPGLCDGDIPTSFVQTVLVVSSGASVDDMQAITRTLLEHRQKLPRIHPSLAALNPRTAWRNVPAPMHPGASRAFQELGFMS